MNPVTRHPQRCMAALLKGVPVPFLNQDYCQSLGCTAPAAYLAVNGSQYLAVCEAHAQEFRTRHSLTASCVSQPKEPAKPTRKPRTRKGGKN